MKTTSQPALPVLEKLDACGEALRWVGKRDVATAWAECERGDWLLWYAAKVAPRPAAVLAACECARPALDHVPEGEDRPRVAIETAEAWARGGEGAPSLVDVRAAAAHAYA